MMMTENKRKAAGRGRWVAWVFALIVSVLFVVGALLAQGDAMAAPSPVDSSSPGGPAPSPSSNGSGSGSSSGSGSAGVKKDCLRSLHVSFDIGSLSKKYPSLLTDYKLSGRTLADSTLVLPVSALLQDDPLAITISADESCKITAPSLPAGAELKERKDRPEAGKTPAGSKEYQLVFEQAGEFSPAAIRLHVAQEGDAGSDLKLGAAPGGKDGLPSAIYLDQGMQVKINGDLHQAAASSAAHLPLRHVDSLRLEPGEAGQSQAAADSERKAFRARLTIIKESLKNAGETRKINLLTASYQGKAGIPTKRGICPVDAQTQVSDSLNCLAASEAETSSWLGHDGLYRLTAAQGLPQQANDQSKEAPVSSAASLTGWKDSDGLSIDIDSLPPSVEKIAVTGKTTDRGGWLVATGPVTVAFSGLADDSGSGIDWSSSAIRLVSCPSSKAVDCQKAADYRPAGADKAISLTIDKDRKTASFTISKDNERIDLTQASFLIQDKEGNAFCTGPLSRFAPAAVAAGQSGQAGGAHAGQAEARSRSAGETNALFGKKGLVIDSVAPDLVINATGGEAVKGKYYGYRRVFTVTVTDSTFDLLQEVSPDQVIVTYRFDSRGSHLTASDFQAVPGQAGKYQATFEAGREGGWSYLAQFADLGGRLSDKLMDSFVVILSRPQATLSFDNNDVRTGKYFNKARTATIFLHDRYPDLDASRATISIISHDGKISNRTVSLKWEAVDGQGPTDPHNQSWKAQIPFDHDGDYRLEVSLFDLAGNQVRAGDESDFVIDTTSPEIKLDQVKDKTAYAGDLAPSISYADQYADMSKATFILTGARRGLVKTIEGVKEKETDEDKLVSLPDFSHQAQTDDVYTLEARLTDFAGNTTTKDVTFSVNRFGSTYMLMSGTKIIRGRYLREAPTVSLAEINVSGLKPGTQSVSILHDTSVQTLSAHDLTTTTSPDAGWSRTTYQIDRSHFTDNGYYRVVVRSVDQAGNVSTNTMDKKDEDRRAAATVQFAVDTVDPYAVATNISGDSVYQGSSKQVYLTGSDNVRLKEIQVDVNGKAYARFSADALSKGEDASFTLPASDQAYTIVVRSADQAGNVSSTRYENVTVTRNYGGYLSHHGGVLLALILACSALVIALIVALVALYRRRKVLAYRRNPFLYTR